MGRWFGEDAWPAAPMAVDAFSGHLRVVDAQCRYEAGGAVARVAFVGGWNVARPLDSCQTAGMAAAAARCQDFVVVDRLKRNPRLGRAIVAGVAAVGGG